MSVAASTNSLSTDQALIWENWWQASRERGGGGVEAVADRPGGAMF